MRIVADEPGRAATVAYLRDHETRVTSILSAVEVSRAGGGLGPPTLRTLDAIHLATAMELGRELDAFVTYDTRLAVAARWVGLVVAAP